MDLEEKSVMDDEWLRVLISLGSLTLNLNCYRCLLPLTRVHGLLHLLLYLQKGVGAVTSSHYKLYLPVK